MKRHLTLALAAATGLGLTLSQSSQARTAGSLTSGKLKAGFIYVGPTGDIG
ncbi:MAG: hypothetical protein ACR2J4_05950 [Deinococcus sp.]